MTEENERIIMRALQSHGKNMQTIVAIEELSELIAVLARHQFRRRNDTTIDDVCSEIADVIIICETLKLIYSEDKIMEFVDKKLKRLEKSL